MTTSFKDRLKDGQTLIGPLVTLASADVADIMSRVGYDYLWIDTEHAPTGFVHAQMMLQAAGGRCPCLIRIPDNNEVWMKKALDIGCDGIVVPQVKSAAEARAIVECCLYPPAGRRSVGVSRAHGYGMSFEDYVSHVNDKLAIVVQVEHIEGVEHIESIAAVPGIDAIFVGPYDLSASMNLLGQVTHPRVMEAIETVKRYSQAAGLPTGLFATNVELAAQAIQSGFSLIALGMDATYLWQAARSTLTEVRAAFNN